MSGLNRIRCCKCNRSTEKSCIRPKGRQLICNLCWKIYWQNRRIREDRPGKYIEEAKWIKSICDAVGTCQVCEKQQASELWDDSMNSAIVLQHFNVRNGFFSTIDDFQARLYDIVAICSSCYAEGMTMRDVEKMWCNFSDFGNVGEILLDQPEWREKYIQSIKNLVRAANKVPLPHPTTELVGSDAKIEVMAQRLSRGESLFHPDDSTLRADADSSRMEHRPDTWLDASAAFVDTVRRVWNAERQLERQTG